MKKLCVIGDPVEHSKSPLIQNTMLGALGLDGEYVYGKERVAGADTALFLARAESEGYVGFNATMPHKENLVPLMDELEPYAAEVGAVNTVCIREGKYYGFNTDGAGFLASLREAGVSAQGKTVVLLGAGGAAKSVALALRRMGGARAVFVCNRHIERAAAICRWDDEGGMAPAGFEPETLCRLAARCDLLVNATALGMEGTKGQFEDLGFLEALPPEAAVCDLIYAPLETELLRTARELGHRTMNGLGMLVWQAIFALEHFTETKIDGRAMAALLRERLNPPVTL